MSPWEAFWAGIAPEHLAGLMLTALLPLMWWLSRALTPPVPAGSVALPLADRCALVALAVTAAMHVGLPIGHHDNGWLTAGFLASGVAYGWFGLRVYRRQSWRLLTSLLVAATLIGYLIVITFGGEEPDQVGIVTALDEIILLGLALTPAPDRRFARAAGSTATIIAIMLVGVTVWIGSFRAHQAADLDATPLAAPDAPAIIGASAGGHDHDHAARAQAGVVMKPTTEHASADQVRAAIDLADASKTTAARYADIRAALDDGYRPKSALTGTEVHLENKAYNADGRILDPEHPEALVYAVLDGKAALLGVMYEMPTAGTPGPTPGGPITRWHAHNVCLTVLPPGFGLASPFGGCPTLSISVTGPEMMHVWTSGNPGGPYAEVIEPAWARAYTDQHGIAWTP